ncbi:DUF4400 domain-containing protein [Pseudomonas sp. 3HC3]
MAPLVPWSINPNWILLPCAALLAYMMAITAASF